MKQKTHLLAQVEISEGRGGSSTRPRSRPFRSTVRRRRSSPLWKWKSMLSRSGWPLIARIRSPGRSSPRPAGLREATEATTTPGASAGAVPQVTALRSLPCGGRMLELLEALNHVLQSRGDGERGGDPGKHPRAVGQQLEVERGH